jgi:hypothetical protein
MRRSQMVSINRGREGAYLLRIASTKSLGLLYFHQGILVWGVNEKLYCMR